MALSGALLLAAAFALAAPANEASEADFVARLAKANENVSCGVTISSYKPDIPAGVLDARRFVAIALLSSLPERQRTMAVAADGTVALLPEDFGKLVAPSFKQGFDGGKALILARAWLVTKAPPADAFEPIDDPSSPRYNAPKRGNKAVDVAHLVAAPRAEAAPEGFKVVMASWRVVGGEVDVWTFVISASAEILKVEKKNAAGAAGQYQVAN